MTVEHNKETDYYSFLSGKHWITDPIQALFMSGPRKALFKMITEHSPKRLLDICCGTGGMAKQFTSVGIETMGIDSSKTMLKRAEIKARITHAQLMDASRMEFNKEFDVAYINLAIHEMAADMRELVWKKMLQAVRDGGMVAVMDLNAPQEDTTVSRFWQRFFELDERNFLRTNPDHYNNYCEFMKNGGLHNWMNQKVERLESEKYFFAGNIAVISVIV